MMTDHIATSDSWSYVFAVPVKDYWLLHAPLHGLSALVNRAAVDALRLYCNEGKAPAGEALMELCRSLDSPVQKPEPSRGAPTPDYLGILPTRACNMQCRYCDFHSQEAPGGVMDLRLAASAVDWMADWVHESGSGHLEVHFFGGEPFVAQNVVETTVHRARAWAGQLGLSTHFEASSNGIYNERQARFISDYFDTIILSLDGFADTHDLHRPLAKSKPSFQAVTDSARRLAHSPVELCLRACVSTHNLERLPQIAEWFCTGFQPSVINFETLLPNPRSEAAGLAPPNPFDFAAQLARALDIAESHGVKAVYASAETSRARSSFCPVGQDTLIVSPDGRVSGCYLVAEDWLAKGLDLDLGRITPAGEMDLDQAAVQRLRDLVFDKPHCGHCFCRWNCAGGCHVSNSYADAGQDFTDFCLQTRAITAWSLLKKLGHTDLAAGFVSDRRAMEDMAVIKDDLIFQASL